MVDKAEIKPESLLNLDDLLQCPVCYEIPSGQIFQCNEGHHVCGRCKMRLDVCPVCRALFFGTRNYAMEELIANFRKLRSFKLGAKAQNGSGSSESSAPAKETTSGECENDTNEEDEENNPNIVNEPAQRAPQACKGLFRCLCCKTGNGERLPAARLLNHLRYFHAPDLLEGRTENGEYLQAWQFSTTPGKIVTAIRIADMGIFFLTIEFNNDSVYAWLTMAASPWVAHAFHYTVTICGNDREAIFSDCVWSVRSCEGSLKKRGHCLVVKEMDARALMAPAIISGKLSVRRTPPDQLAVQAQPRAVLRIANRGNDNTNTSRVVGPSFLEDIHNDVERLYLAFANFGRQTNALMRAELEEVPGDGEHQPDGRTSESAEDESQQPANQEELVGQHMSRHARRRMRLRARAALIRRNEPMTASAPAPAQAIAPVTASRQNGPEVVRRRMLHPLPVPTPQAVNVTYPTSAHAPALAPVPIPRTNAIQESRPVLSRQVFTGHSTTQATGLSPRLNGSEDGGLLARPAPTPQAIGRFAPPATGTSSPPLPPPSTSGPSRSQPQTGNVARNKKKRRHRR